MAGTLGGEKEVCEGAVVCEAKVGGFGEGLIAEVDPSVVSGLGDLVFVVVI